MPSRSDINKYLDFRSVVTIVTALSVFVGLVLGVNAYFAKEREFVIFKQDTTKTFAEVSIRQLVHEVEQTKAYIQEKIWKIEDRQEKRPNDPALLEQKRMLEEEKKKTDERIQDLKK